MVASCGVYSLFLERDALHVVFAIQKPHMLDGWNFSSVISDISLYLLSFKCWKALIVFIVFRSVNFRAHSLTQ